MPSVPNPQNPRKIEYDFPRPSDRYGPAAVHSQLIYATTCPECGAIIIPTTADTHTDWHNRYGLLDV